CGSRRVCASRVQSMAGSRAAHGDGPRGVMNRRWLVLAAVGACAHSHPGEVPNAIIVSVGGDPDSIAVVDVDGDGALDLVVASPNAGTVAVLRNDGKAHFTPVAGSPFRAGAQPTDVAAGDLDGDGHVDLVIANHQTSYVTVLRGDGRGAFAPAPGSPDPVAVNPHP